jgi:hypothetical protein
MPAAQVLRYPSDPMALKALMKENTTLRNEIRVAREAAEITASLVVKQFEETETVSSRFSTPVLKTCWDTRPAR